MNFIIICPTCLTFTPSSLLRVGFLYVPERNKPYYYYKQTHSGISKCFNGYSRARLSISKCRYINLNFRNAREYWFFWSKVQYENAIKIARPSDFPFSALKILLINSRMWPFLLFWERLEVILKLKLFTRQMSLHAWVYLQNMSPILISSLRREGYILWYLGICVNKLDRTVVWYKYFWTSTTRGRHQPQAYFYFIRLCCQNSLWTPKQGVVQL